MMGCCVFIYQTQIEIGNLSMMLSILTFIFFSIKMMTNLLFKAISELNSTDIILIIIIIMTLFIIVIITNLI